MADVYLDTIKRMEKDIAMVDLPAAAASVAISLKRIADALEESNRLQTIIAKHWDEYSERQKKND